ncbi:MAG: dGTP triphosphohydrolase, partial [Beijerinckiaceae bacterium]
LGLDEDLAETLALAHDLGHTPFGHAGERALDRALARHGGFDHNAQSLKIVTTLERRYAAFDGLNLTFETLEGLVKHNGPLTDRSGSPVGKLAGKAVPEPIAAYDRVWPLELSTFATGEAQAAAIADDIAYNAHDIDDGLRSGVLGLEDFRALPFVAAILADISAAYPDLDPVRTTHELQRRLITAFVEGVIGEAERRLAALAPPSSEALRLADRPVIAFPADLAAADSQIKAFLFPRLYRSRRIMDVMSQAEAMVEELFAELVRNPKAMPADWRAGWDALDERGRALRVGDYIAGMTDRYARDQHALLSAV